VFLAGDFTSVNGVSCGRYALLLPDGSLDPQFDSSIGADNTIYSSVVQPDGKVVIGGDFSSVNGVVRKGVARVNVGDSLPLTLGMPILTPFGAILTVSTVPGRTYVLEVSSDFDLGWAPLSTNTASTTSLVFTDPNATGSPRRYYRARRF
jgi:hypothetical protein